MTASFDAYREEKPLTEAHLGQKASGGVPSWDKYVRDNKQYKEIEFQIENKQKNVPVYDDEGNVVQKLKAGDTFHIIDPRTWFVEGQKGNYAKTNIGYIEINKIRKPTTTDVMSAEKAAFRDFQKEINDIRMEHDTFDLGIGKYTVKNVYGIIRPKGDPKADFCLIDHNNNYIGFISHKKAGGKGAFQQLGGISKKSGVQNHKEVKAFAEALDEYVAQYGVHAGLAVWRPIKDAKLKNQAVYGPDFPGAFGLDHCHCIGQGHPYIKGKDGKYYLDFEEEFQISGDAGKWKGDMEPILFASMRSDRNFNSPTGSVIPKVRAGIYIKAIAETRKKLTKI